MDGQIVFVLQESVNLRRRCLLFLMRMICANFGSSFCRKKGERRKEKWGAREYASGCRTDAGE